MLPSYLPKAAPSSIDLKEDESQLVELLNYYRHKVGKYKQIYKPSTWYRQPRERKSRMARGNWANETCYRGYTFKRRRYSLKETWNCWNVKGSQRFASGNLWWKEYCQYSKTWVWRIAKDWEGRYEKNQGARVSQWGGQEDRKEEGLSSITNKEQVG